MSREDRRRRLQAQRKAGAMTFTDVVRHIARRPAPLIKLLLVLAVVVGVCTALLPARFEGPVAMGLGMSISVWIIRRS